MNKIILAPSYSPSQVDKLFKGRWIGYAEARALDFEFVDRAGAEFRTPDGKFIARLVPNVFDLSTQAARHRLWSQVAGTLRNRPSVFDQDARLPLFPKSGGPGTRIGVPPSILAVTGGASATLGLYRYHARKDGLPHCDLTGWTKERPDLYGQAVNEAVLLTNLFENILPEEYAEQMKYVESILPEWKIPGTAFTSIYGIKNFSTACHRDTFDIPSGTGVITTSGVFYGNEFIIPEFKLAFDLKPSDALFVDVHRLHGNLPRLLGERVAQVYFVRKGMHECGELAAQP